MGIRREGETPDKLPVRIIDREHAKQLKALKQVWGWYTSPDGPGSNMSDDEKYYVYEKALFEITEDFGLSPEECDCRLGFSSEEVSDDEAKLKSERDGYYVAGLKRRAVYLADVAKGDKPLPLGAELIDDSCVAGELMPKAPVYDGTLLDSTLEGVKRLYQDPRYYERGFGEEY